MSNSYIWLIDRTLSGVTNLGLGRTGSNGNEGVHILLASSIAASPSDGLVSYPGHSLVGEDYSSGEMLLMYSTAPADWACEFGSNGNEVVLYIPQSSKIAASLSDGLVLYPGYLFGESYPSAKMQSVYSSAPANWAQIIFKTIKQH